MGDANGDETSDAEVPSSKDPEEPESAVEQERSGMGDRGPKGPKEWSGSGFRLNENLAERLRDVVRGPSSEMARRVQESMNLGRIWESVWPNKPVIPASVWARLSPKMPVVFDEAWMRRLMAAPTDAFLEQIRVDIPAFDFSRLIRPEVWTGLDRLVESLRRLIPANLRDLEVDEWARLVEISEEQRVGVAWVPRVEVLRLLLAAGSAEARAQVLRGHAETILDDCVASLDETTHGALLELVEFAVEASETHRAGRTRAAQALATNVLDTGLEQYHEDGVKGFRAACKRLPDLDEDGASLLEVRLRMVTAGIPSAYNGYDYEKRNTRFSRTGTAHAVNAALYTPDNSLRAITLATVWLRWLHETWTEEDRRDATGDD